ncbi:MAG: single-stranded DNA-binding protein [Clostridium celatum]|uniref:single-stranded DNA-binding protein n=1 Tax=Clostridium tertium TaxID=1559 RepID=UPI002902F26D|nr:single-stranded DNA-binding protein [Clostridium celatum]
MNEVNLYGRIAKDLPNIEELTNRPLLLLFAVERFVAGEKKTDFLPIKVWGKDAERVCKYKSKGDELLIKAYLKMNSYEKNGEKVFTLEIIAEKVRFVGGSKTDSAKLTELDETKKDVNTQSNIVSEDVIRANKHIDNNSEHADNNSYESKNDGISNDDDDDFWAKLVADSMGADNNPLFGGK